MKSCMSIAVGVLLVLSHMAVVVGAIVVATDLTHVGKWGVFAGLVVFAIIVTVVFRMMGHRVGDAYEILNIFSW